MSRAGGSQLSVARRPVRVLPADVARSRAAEGPDGEARRPVRREEGRTVIELRRDPAQALGERLYGLLGRPGVPSSSALTSPR